MITKFSKIAARTLVIAGLISAGFSVHAASTEAKTTQFNEVFDPSFHHCEVIAGGVTCAGNNDLGQLGDGSRISQKAPVQTILPYSKVSQISVAASHTCVAIDGGAQCWGSNQFGQLGASFEGTEASMRFEAGAGFAFSAQPVVLFARGSGVLRVAAFGSTRFGSAASCAVLVGGVSCVGDVDAFTTQIDALSAQHVEASTNVASSVSAKSPRQPIKSLALGDITIIAPANGATVFTSTSFDIKVNAIAATAKVDYFADTFFLGSVTSATPNFTRPTTLLSAGSRVIKAIAYNASNVKIEETSITINAVAPPALSITSPAAGASIVSNTVFQIRVAANTATTKVEYYADTFLLGTMTNASANFVRDTSLINTGNRVIRAVSFNASNVKIADVSINITVVAAPVSAQQAVLNTAISNAIAAAPGIQIGINAIDYSDRSRTLSSGGTIIMNSASSPKWMWLAAALSKKTIAQVTPNAIPTMTDSNNSTAGALIDQAGGIAAVNAYAVSLGIPQSGWSLCKWNVDVSRSDPNCNQARAGSNFFNANAAIIFINKMYDNQALTDPAKSAQLRQWGLLSPDSGDGGWIGTQLPASVRPNIQHKEGAIPAPASPNTNHEIGIVRTESGRDYGVVIATEGSPTYLKANKTLEYLSCVIYKLMNTPGNTNVVGCTL